MADGSLESFEVVWVVKKQVNGQWRVSGMAMEGPDKKIVLFDFEKPAEMLAQRDALAQAYNDQDKAPAATVPPNSLRAGSQPSGAAASTARATNNGPTRR